MWNPHYNLFLRWLIILQIKPFCSDVLNPKKNILIMFHWAVYLKYRQCIAGHKEVQTFSDLCSQH